MKLATGYAMNIAQPFLVYLCYSATTPSTGKQLVTPIGLIHD